MADETFKVGDVVALNSGSPEMTVLGIENSWIVCGYFRDEIFIQTISLPSSALKKA